MTRLLGQRSSGLSATGESDTRNYDDMIAACQELDLRPRLEQLDRIMLLAAFGPIGASAVSALPRHLATVLGFGPEAAARARLLSSDAWSAARIRAVAWTPP